jgi:hypothetical protein
MLWRPRSAWARVLAPDCTLENAVSRDVLGFAAGFCAGF